MKREDIIAKAIQSTPRILDYLSFDARMSYYKSSPIPRDELERKISRLILAVDRSYLRVLEEQGIYIPGDFWTSYEADLRRQIATPLRAYIEQSFTNYSDYVNFIDKAGAVDDINTAMTRAINEMAGKITENTRAKLNDLIRQGLTQDEIIENIALRFSSGHAEQVAITEITRAEGYFSEALNARLEEQGLTGQIRWLTAEDEKVCPLCGPLDHKLKKDGGWVLKNGQTVTAPPVHPNCRCQTVVELKRG